MGLRDREGGRLFPRVESGEKLVPHPFGAVLFDRRDGKGLAAEERAEEGGGVAEFVEDDELQTSSTQGKSTNQPDPKAKNTRLMEHIPVLRLNPHRQIRNPSHIRDSPRRPHNHPKQPQPSHNLKHILRQRFVRADKSFELVAAVEEGVFGEDGADVVAEGFVRVVVV